MVRGRTGAALVKDGGLWRYIAVAAERKIGMELLGWLIVGLFAGALARLVMPGRDPGGCVVTILLGIAGALLAGYVGRMLGIYAPGEQASFIAAAMGSIAILALYRVFAGRN